MYFLRKMSIQAGAPVECLSIPVEVVKDKVTLPDGSENFKVGLRIGGGIDQDPSSSPFKCADTGIYITHIDANGAAERAGLQIHDKILQVNGYDFTMVTHEKAIHYIKKYPVLKMLIARKGVAGR